MTAEDLEQIKQVIQGVAAELRAEFRADLEHAVNELRAEFRADLEHAVSELRTEIRANQDRAAESFATELTQVREELTARIDQLSRRVGTLEERVSNLAPVIISLDARMATFTRSMDRLVGLHDDVAATQAAQQRAIDQLAARITRIEKELHPGQ
jgi:chromosome segregation ATPase